METGTIFEKSPWRAIMSMSIPSLVSILVMMLYNMADMYFVGWTKDLSQVGAVSLAGPLFSILMAISSMIGNGSCTRIAQAVGQKDFERVRRCTALCTWTSIVLGVVFAVVCFLLQNPLLRFLGANEEMWNHTRNYVLIMAAGAPVVLLNHSLGGAIRGEGEIKTNMVGGMVSTLANIALDPIFIIVLGLGAAGAAIATLLGNAAALVYYFWIKNRSHGRCIIELRPQYAKDRKELGGILALGLPNAISSSLSGFAGTFSNRLLVGYGTGAVAAMAVAGKSAVVVTMVQMGICMGTQPLLAYCCGKMDWARLKNIVKKLLLLTASLGVGLTVVIFLARPILVGLFIKDTEAAALGVRLMTFQLLLGPVIGLYYLATNFLQACGAAMEASVASALRQGLLLIPLLYLMNYLFQLDGLALAHTAADGIAILISGGMAIYHYRKLAASTADSIPATDKK